MLASFCCFSSNGKTCNLIDQRIELVSLPVLYGKRVLEPEKQQHTRLFMPLHSTVCHDKLSRPVMINQSNSIEETDSPVKALRALLNLSQEDFARLLGVSTRRVQRWEAGTSQPSFTIAQFRKLDETLRSAGWSLDVLPDDLRPGNKLQLG